AALHRGAGRHAARDRRAARRKRAGDPGCQWPDAGGGRQPARRPGADHPMTPTATANASAPTLVLRYTQQIGELTHAARLYQRTTRKHQLYKVLGALVIFLAAWLVLTRGPAVGPALLVVLGAFLWFDPVPLLVIYGAF